LLRRIAGPEHVSLRRQTGRLIEDVAAPLELADGSDADRIVEKSDVAAEVHRAVVPHRSDEHILLDLRGSLLIRVRDLPPEVAGHRVPFANLDAVGVDRDGPAAEVDGYRLRDAVRHARVPLEELPGDEAGVDRDLES